MVRVFRGGLRTGQSQLVKTKPGQTPAQLLKAAGAKFKLKAAKVKGLLLVTLKGKDVDSPAAVAALSPMAELFMVKPGEQIAGLELDEENVDAGPARPCLPDEIAALVLSFVPQQKLGLGAAVLRSDSNCVVIEGDDDNDDGRYSEDEELQWALEQGRAGGARGGGGRRDGDDKEEDDNTDSSAHLLGLLALCTVSKAWNRLVVDLFSIQGGIWFWKTDDRVRPWVPYQPDTSACIEDAYSRRAATATVEIREAQISSKTRRGRGGGGGGGGGGSGGVGRSGGGSSGRGGVGKKRLALIDLKAMLQRNMTGKGRTIDLLRLPRTIGSGQRHKPGCRKGDLSCSC